MAGPFDAPLDSRDTNDISDNHQHNVPNDPMALAAAATRESLTQNYKLPQYEFEGKVARVAGPAAPPPPPSSARSEWTFPVARPPSQTTT